MVFGLYFFRRNNPFDNAFFVNDKSGTEGTHVFASIHAFSPHTPKVSTSLCSVSAISVNGSWFFSMNFGVTSRR